MDLHQLEQTFRARLQHVGDLAAKFLNAAREGLQRRLETSPFSGNG